MKCSCHTSMALHFTRNSSVTTNSHLHDDGRPALRPDKLGQQGSYFAVELQTIEVSHKRADAA